STVAVTSAMVGLLGDWISALPRDRGGQTTTGRYRARPARSTRADLPNSRSPAGSSTRDLTCRLGGSAFGAGQLPTRRALVPTASGEPDPARGRLLDEVVRSGGQCGRDDECRDRTHAHREEHVVPQVEAVGDLPDPPHHGGAHPARPLH